MLDGARSKAIADQFHLRRLAGKLLAQRIIGLAAVGIDKGVKRPQNFLAVAPDILSRRLIGLDPDDL